MERRSGPRATWFVVAGAIFLVSVVTGALVAKSGARNTVQAIRSTQVGPASSGHIYFEDHLSPGVHTLVYSAPGLVNSADVPKVTLSVRRVGGPSVSVRLNPRDAYLDPSYAGTSSAPITSTTYRSRGRVEIAVFAVPFGGDYHLEGQIRAAPATSAAVTSPSLEQGELRLYPYRLRDESDTVFNGIFGVLSRVGLGILIAAVGLAVSLAIAIVVAVGRSRANRPPPGPGPPGPYGPWSPPPGPYGPWSGGPPPWPPPPAR